MLVLLTLSAWFVVPRAAHAQEVPPQQSPPPASSGPSLGDLSGAIGRAFGDALAHWFDETVATRFQAAVAAVPQTVGQWAQALLSLVVHALLDFLRSLLDRLNIITTLPPGLTYNLPAVIELRTRLTRLAGAMLGLVIVVQVLWAGYGTTMGRPWQSLLPGASRVLAAGIALRLAPPVMAWWMDFCNALSNSLLTLQGGLPGMEQLSGVGQAAAELVAACLYVLFALLLVIGRVCTLAWVDVLLVATPLALAVWALPFGAAQRFGGWWGREFLLTTFVQLPLAIVMALAAGIVTAVGTSGLGDVAQWFVSDFVLIGLLWTAFRLPSRLQGASQAMGAAAVAQTARVAARVAAAVL